MNEIIRYSVFEQLLEDIVAEIEISPSRYEEAERAYRSVADWLERPESSLKRVRPTIHVQGSFALGLATKPATDEDECDVDAVCELHVSKAACTQSQLKEALGHELRLYARGRNMNEEPERKNRCWTLNYAEEAQFHLDTLPAVPDAQTAQQIYAQYQVINPWWTTAVAITDERHPDFSRICATWLRSNPRGYANWFRSRMAATFERKRKQLAAALQAKVEDIPEYKVKTPLQAAIQILKRHRDLWAIGQPERKPISIIVTTLAAHSYQQEQTISQALQRILSDMDRFIENRTGVVWIVNPSDPLENFADRWRLEPGLRLAFFEWLAQARQDFQTAAGLNDRAQLIALMSARLGERAVRVAAKKRVAPHSVLARLSRSLRELFGAPHRQKPMWPAALAGGQVRIVEAVASRNGFRDKRITSDGTPLSKHASLRFEARTDIAHPYKVYWQVVNTGGEAARANGLRGTFEEHQPVRGKLTKHESTLYTGTHSIQCFIVKDGLLAAQSDPFIVNIR